jgi:hypothetical protein
MNICSRRSRNIYLVSLKTKNQFFSVFGGSSSGQLLQDFVVDDFRFGHVRPEVESLSAESEEITRLHARQRR